jgi:hypothetical protein
MRYHLGAVLIAGALIVATAELPLNAVANSSQIERAVVTVDEPVRLLGVVLHGRYLFLHHDGMMEHGRPCMFVYTLDSPNEGTRVLAFHCKPIVRPRSLEFKLVMRNVPGDLPEAIEVQFAGTAEGHQVPDYEPAES